MTLPDVIEHMRKHLKEDYNEDEWRPAFDAVLSAENDPVSAVEAVTELMNSHMNTNPIHTAPPSQNDPKRLEELDETEKRLMEAVENLQGRRRIWGTALSLEELLNPIEEKEIGETAYNYPNGIDDIIKQVQEEQEGKRRQEESDTSSEEDEEEEDASADKGISPAECINLCQKMEKLVLTHSDVEGLHVLQMQRQMRLLCRHLRLKEQSSKQQTTLESFFGRA